MLMLHHFFSSFEFVNITTSNCIFYEESCRLRRENVWLITSKIKTVTGRDSWEEQSPTKANSRLEQKLEIHEVSNGMMQQLLEKKGLQEKFKFIGDCILQVCQVL